MEKTVLGILAHPDDAEILCAGTLSLLKNAGWSVHIATVAMGDKGTARHSRDEIIKIRNAEAKKSAAIIGGTYHCLEIDDIYLFYNRESINKATSLIRKVRPSIVFTSSPSDYMLDHEISSLIAQTGCFCAGIKNMDVKEEPFEPIPSLYYCDPIEGKDKMGELVHPSTYVDISGEIETKTKMLACHESQQSWLLSHQDSEYILAMKQFSEKRGKEINTAYAEGFRQHLGHGYPHDNILKEILGDLVVTK
ncbi:MAG: PIG-L family deacetylase [Bacteroidales bacterium]|nr:PIG-L family deacetylase [Bacteroidales bacterium]